MFPFKITTFSQYFTTKKYLLPLIKPYFLSPRFLGETLMFHSYLTPGKTHTVSPILDDVPLVFSRHVLPNISQHPFSDVHILSHANFMSQFQAAPRYGTSRACPATRNSTLSPLLRETLVTESSRLEARKAVARSSAKHNCLGNSNWWGILHYIYNGIMIGNDW